MERGGRTDVTMAAAGDPRCTDRAAGDTSERQTGQPGDAREGQA